MKDELIELFTRIDRDLVKDDELQLILEEIKDTLADTFLKKSVMSFQKNANTGFKLYDKHDNSETSIISILHISLKNIIEDSDNLDRDSKNILIYMYVESTRLLLCDCGYNYYDKEVDRQKLLTLTYSKLVL